MVTGTESTVCLQVKKKLLHPKVTSRCQDTEEMMATDDTPNASLRSKIELACLSGTS